MWKYILAYVCCFLIAKTNCAQNEIAKERKSINDQLEISKEWEKKNDSKGLKIANQALLRATKLKDLNLMGKAENSVGNFYWYSGEYSLASEHYFKAMKHYQKAKNKFEIATCQRNIGWIYLGQNRFDQSEAYFQKSSATFKKMKNQRDYLTSLDDLGNLYLTKGDYQKALNSCLQSMTISKSTGNELTYGTTSGTIAFTYYYLGEGEKAKRYYLQSSQILKKYPRQEYNRCQCYMGLAKIMRDNRQYDQALLYLDSAVFLGKKGNFNTELSDSYALSSEIFNQLNQHKKAYEMQKLYASLQDSLYALNNRDFIKELENKNKIEQDRLKIKNLEQKAKLDNANLEREQLFKIALVIVMVLILFFVFFLIRSFMRKKKANETLTTAYAIIETKNKDISDSIDYAQHIQHARLPLLEHLQVGFNDVFVYYKPRDIVSGDFYWYDKREDGTIYFVCADCTGHGIPGAFMSMMGIDGFNYAILERGLQHTGEILTHVNQFIKDSLNQEHESAKSKDGMDAAIIALNPDKTILSYAGANRPLYLIRNGELMELKPDKLSIGGNHLSTFNFTEQQMQIQKGDCIYLFSDGYTDQFGGEKGKKFMTKQLKEILLSIHLDPMKEQQSHIDQTFIRWKNTLSQVDDVLLVGISI